MFEDDYYEQYFELGKAIELNQKDKISVCAAGLYDEPDSPLRRNGDTALHVAAENGNNEIFMVIWKQILTSPHVKNASGELPLHYACREGALSVIKIYVQEMKVSVDLKTPVGWTGLFYAAFNNQIPVVEYLISKKAHINGVDKFYRSPLHYAAKYGFVEVLKKLVEAGGDLDFKDKEGVTARQIINNWEDKEIRPKIESIFALVKKKGEKKTIDHPTAETFGMAVPTENEKTFNYSVSTLILPAKTPILLTVGYFMQNLITTNEATELFTRKHIKLDSARLKSKIKFYLYYNEKITTSNENNQENYIELEPCYMLLPKELAESYGEIFKPTPKAQTEKKIENTITEGIDPNWKETFYKFFSLLVLQPTKTNFLAGKLKEEQILNISEKPFAGQSIFTISSPFALLSPILYKNTVNVSYVSRVAQSKSRWLFGGSKRSYLFFINHTAKDGEEGAPVFNEYSEVIGILLGKILPESPDLNGYSVCLSTSSIVELLSMLSFQHSSNDVWKLTASRFKPFIQSLSLKSLLPRIVKILTGSALGSGILLNTAGFILTNKHVLMSNKNRKIVIEVNFNNNQNDYEYYDAEIFKEAEGNIDIALLKITKKLSERAIKVIKATERFLDHPIDVRYLHGKEVYALGYTFNEFKTVDFRAIVTRGNLSKIIVYRNTPFLLATNCQTFNGFSGGAIVSDRGEFLGLITYNFTQKKKGALNSLNFSYSCNIFKEMINLIEVRDEENLQTLDIWKNQDGYVDKMIQAQNLELVPRFDFKAKL